MVARVLEFLYRVPKDILWIFFDSLRWLGNSYVYLLIKYLLSGVSSISPKLFLWFGLNSEVIWRAAVKQKIVHHAPIVSTFLPSNTRVVAKRWQVVATWQSILEERRKLSLSCLVYDNPSDNEEPNIKTFFWPALPLTAPLSSSPSATWIRTPRQLWRPFCRWCEKKVWIEVMIGVYCTAQSITLCQNKEVFFIHKFSDCYSANLVVGTPIFHYYYPIKLS